MRAARTLLVGLLLVLLAGVAPARAEVVPYPVGVDADYQLGGVAEVPSHVGVVVRDRSADPAGVYDICYVNAFQTQPGQQAPWRRRPGLVLRDGDGRAVVDEAWGERLLDLRTPAKRRALTRIVGRWVEDCARAGYEAVELDNLDSYTRSHGLLTRRHTLAYARLLVRRSHDAGLAVAQKNLAGLDGSRLGFDFAIAEECGRYDECERYATAYADRVLVVEYRRRDFDAACAAWGGRLSIVLRDREVTPDGVRRWC